MLQYSLGYKRGGMYQSLSWISSPTNGQSVLCHIAILNYLFCFYIVLCQFTVIVACVLILLSGGNYIKKSLDIQMTLQIVLAFIEQLSKMFFMMNSGGKWRKLNFPKKTLLYCLFILYFFVIYWKCPSQMKRSYTFLVSVIACPPQKNWPTKIKKIYSIKPFSSCWWTNVKSASSSSSEKLPHFVDNGVCTIIACPLQKKWLTKRFLFQKCFLLLIVNKCKILFFLVF